MYISLALHNPYSNSNLFQAMLQGEDPKRTGQQSRPYLLRRGTAAPTGGSFKRRSLKLRRGTKEGKDIDLDCKYKVFSDFRCFLKRYCFRENSRIRQKNGLYSIEKKS